MSFQIILGSALAARRTILVEMGYHFTVVTANIDEKKMLLFQGSKVREQLNGDAPATQLITADTVDNKGETIMQGRSMEFYQGYSGGQAAVIGSVLVTNIKNRKKKRWLAQSRGFVAIRASRLGAYSDFDLYRKREPLNFIKGKVKVGVSYYSNENK
ncbi:hypothetical protein PS2_004027 [Malus domestica]